MKTSARIFFITLCLIVAAGYRHPVQAQDPILEVIRTGVKKAIVAVDLKVQRLQNKTIWLQQAQQVLENKLTALRLGEIADWTERQRLLYAAYYEELRQVKAAIGFFQRVRDLVRQQEALVEAHRQAFRLLRQEGIFSAQELDYMQRVYGAILEESVQQLDLLLLATRPSSIQLQDSQRLRLIHQAADRMEQLYSDLREFNEQNTRLSLLRSGERQQLQLIKQLHNLSTDN